MLTPKNNANFMRAKILIEVAKHYFDNKFANADKIPADIKPDDSTPFRGSLSKDRQIIREQCLTSMGFSLDDGIDADSHTLAEFGKMALERKVLVASQIAVIPEACNRCAKPHHVVTNMCQGCFARPCQENCPKKAISFVNGKAFIDESLCINCGICKDSCPYGAIIKTKLPCEDACPVGAISKDENGIEHIDHEKCISCGKCLASCPFGAIVERSQMVDVLRQIHDTENKVIAMVAPAVIGQFNGKPQNLVAALKKIGFDEVVEVAVGADITTQKEAAEFLERMKEGANFMTTSCCPAYFRAADIHIPELKPFVSSTHTPMYYTAELIKKEQPDCIAVFVGPCLAKRVEAESDPYVDYVLTFEEIAAMFIAQNIDVTTAGEAEFSKVSCAQGRLFPVSGGVAGAVQSLVEGKIDFRPEKIDGLTKDSVKLLKRYAQKGSENNMIEVMCCEGGCVSGPGCVALAKKAARSIETYAATGDKLTFETKVGEK